MASIFDQSIQNPCTLWIRFKAANDQGYFEAYDKEAEGDNQRVNLGESLNIVPLFAHFGVDGYNNDSGKGLYSNEIQDITTGILNVKLDNDIIATGTWAEIKDKVKANGGKFAQIVYFALFTRDEEGQILPRIACMKFAGATANAWISSRINLPELRLLTVAKGNLVENRVVSGQVRKLPNPYYGISIEKGKTHKDLVPMCVEFAKTLQAYFDGYFSKGSEALMIESIDAQQPTALHSNQPVMQIGQATEEAKDIDAAFAEASEDDPLASHAELFPDKKSADIDDLPF